MSDNYGLIKSNPLLPAENYEELRKAGFRGIEKLGSAIWTDYNNSDPGITMLEALCYAITDLAYRTGYEVKDLLTPAKLTEQTWKNIFYTARQIFHNNPLTINDYRKLVIDIKGVRNAWITPSKDYEVPVWVDYNHIEKRKNADCGCKDEPLKTCYGKLGLQPVTKDEVTKRNADRITAIGTALTDLQIKLDAVNKKILDLQELISKEKDPLTLEGYKQQQQQQEQQKKHLAEVMAELVNERTILNAWKFIPPKVVELEGLYNVMVEYEENVLEEEHREEVRQQVVERLSAHRNLCEDFLSVNAVEYEDFGIGASIALDEEADPDEVLSQIFFVIYQYFSPSVPFHTIEEMMKKGYQADQIFEGPALHHGFIDDAELAKTELYRDIRLSDIINSILLEKSAQEKISTAVSGIPGVKAITYLHLPFNGFEDKAAAKKYFDEWVDALRQQRKVARIQPSKSAVLFCKEREFITYNTGSSKDRNPARMLKMFSDKKKQERSYKLKGYQNDWPVPSGEFMELQGYYPVTYSLSMCYGVSERAGLPGDADDKRKAQALQLQGYLLFFEQLLVDYLVQLDHLRDLFSFDDKPEKTYFTRAVTELSELKSLLIDHANRGAGNFDLILQDFLHVLHNLVEPPEVFYKRRNRFLDHMLARFGESLAEYETITRAVLPQNADKKLIADKISMLKDGEYYAISSNRGKAYNYSEQQVWDTLNVSGAERRIGRLLGFRDVTRRSLAPEFVFSEAAMDSSDKSKLPVQKKNKKGQLLNVVVITLPGDRQKRLLTSVEVADGCCTELLMGEILAHADERRYFIFREELKQRSRKTAGAPGVFWFELWDGTNPDTAVFLASSEKFDKREDRDHAYKELQGVMHRINENEGLHLVEHLLLRPRIDETDDEINQPVPVVFPDICIDSCGFGLGLGEGTEIPGYQKKIRRIPAEKCYDNMPWVLEYFRFNPKSKKYDQSILYQQTFADGAAPILLKFRSYEQLAGRVRAIAEFGSERINYEIVSNAEEQPVKIKYSFIIRGAKGAVLAQSPYVFNKKTRLQEGSGIKIENDIEIEIQQLMRYFEFELDLYCEPNPCDNDEDPYSFRTTIVLPCWPKRLRDATFRNLVEKTIEAESPAHVHTRVVWIGMEEMRRFEAVYAAWLKEMAQTEMPTNELVNPLVEKLNKLRPCGCCEDDCS